MSTIQAVEYDYFRDECRHETKVEESKKKWIRAREGVDIYSMSRNKLVSLAREAGAAYKIDATILIHVETFEEYLETFRIPGAIMK